MRLLSEQIGDPHLTRLGPDRLTLTVGFSTTQLETSPLAIADLGAVTLVATLKLSTTAQTGGSVVNLALDTNGLTISPPADLPATLNSAWAAASAELVRTLPPYFAFPIPLTFPAGICDIAPHAVAASLLPPATDANQEALSVAIALLASTPAGGLSAGAASRVTKEQDGAVFLSNLLVVKVACCLLSSSQQFSMLPAEVHEATKEEPFCRWENVPNFRLGNEQFDALAFFEIRASEDGGLTAQLQLKKSGTGWDMTVTVTSVMKLVLNGGVLSLQAVPSVVIDTNVAWWVEWLSIVGIVVGAALIVIGCFTVNPLIIAGGFVLGAGLLLGVVGVLVAGLADALLPTTLADPSQLLRLLPQGLTDRLGELSFLTALEWDDLELGGFMTPPGSPALIVAGEAILPAGSGIDLDTGQLVSAGDLTARMDADLKYHAAARPVSVARSVAPRGQQPTGGGAPSALAPLSGVDLASIAPWLVDRQIEAVGASRLVLLGTRPFATIGYSDLAQLGFPQGTTSLGLPGTPAPGADSELRSFAVRTSAGRLASCQVRIDAAGQLHLLYRTYDTPVWLSITPNVSVQSMGKPGVTNEIRTLYGTFTAVPSSQWPPQPATHYRWFWSGIELLGNGLLDAAGTTYSVAGDRCQIQTAAGADLKGWLCAVASKTADLEALACYNIDHTGVFVLPPGGGGYGGGGYGGPGAPSGPGDPGLPGGPPHL